MKIITLTLNPAFDIHCYTPAFAPYHENLAEITDYEAGGKGVNISRALTVNHVENLAFVVLGSENGPTFRAKLEADGMEYQEITVPGRIRENITLHTEGADETRISFPGFPTDNGLLEQTERALGSIAGEGCYVTFTGRVPGGMEMKEVKAFLKRLASRGAHIVIDSRSFSASDLLEVRPWLIKPNQEEISEYLGRSVNTFEEVVEAAQDLHGAGIGNVMISLGAQGALLCCDEGIYVATPPQIEAISTIGAGDSSIAGFLAAATAGEDPSGMLRTAVSYGTAACMRSGTRPPLPEDVKKVSGATEIRKIR